MNSNDNPQRLKVAEIRMSNKKLIETAIYRVSKPKIVASSP
ncbi:hypothetical protein [Nostoc sp.]